MDRIERLACAAILLVVASPALASEGTLVQTPAPAIGLAGVALIGLGYRALKSRINR